jgi:hypothetical protein
MPVQFARRIAEVRLDGLAAAVNVDRPASAPALDGEMRFAADDFPTAGRPLEGLGASAKITRPVHAGHRKS